MKEIYTNEKLQSQKESVIAGNMEIREQPKIVILVTQFTETNTCVQGIHLNQN